MELKEAIATGVLAVVFLITVGASVYMDYVNELRHDTDDEEEEEDWNGEKGFFK